MASSRHVLPVIVVSQFCCTSLWFAGNAVMPDLVANFGLGPGSVGHLTSAVQFGFICGTLLFAILTLADRFSPSRVFFFSALAGALCNLGLVWEANTFGSLLSLRFATGFFLAGIYPVGMKIAADYYREGLGRSLGYLVGALVLGTAFPHLLKGAGNALPWEDVVGTTSLLALAGGILLRFTVPDGPHRQPGSRPDFSGFFKVFASRDFRAAAFGYFGHMWELYAFWAFVPILLETYRKLHPGAGFDIPVLSFAIIGVGGLGCVLGGYVARRAGTVRTAFTALLVSGLCCLLLPLIAPLLGPIAFLCFLLVWGLTVVADSPLFSTLVAQRANPALKGTALTIVNCIGFSVTIFSIQLLTALQQHTASYLPFALLAAGPAFGLAALASGRKKQQ